MIACNQCLSLLTLRDRTPLRQGVLDTTLYDKVCQWFATGRWFSWSTMVSSNNKTNCHDITEILLKVALSTIKPTKINWDIFIKMQEIKKYFSCSGILQDYEDNWCHIFLKFFFKKMFVFYSIKKLNYLTSIYYYRKLIKKNQTKQFISRL